MVRPNQAKFLFIFFWIRCPSLNNANIIRLGNFLPFLIINKLGHQMPGCFQQFLIVLKRLFLIKTTIIHEILESSCYKILWIANISSVTYDVDNRKVVILGNEHMERIRLAGEIPAWTGADHVWTFQGHVFLPGYLGRRHGRYGNIQLTCLCYVDSNTCSYVQSKRKLNKKLKSMFIHSRIIIDFDSCHLIRTAICFMHHNAT